MFLAAGASRPSPLTQHLMLPWGGAVADVPDTATPLTQRGAAWVTHPFGTWEHQADDAVEHHLGA